MSKSLEISTQEVRRNCSDLRDESSRFMQCSRQMFDDGRALDQCWEGNASDTFAQRLQADEPRFTDLFNLINQYCSEIEQSASDYDRLDQQTMQSIQSNSVRQSR